jgi:hypothetical protein
MARKITLKTADALSRIGKGNGYIWLGPNKTQYEIWRLPKNSRSGQWWVSRVNLLDLDGEIKQLGGYDSLKDVKEALGRIADKWWN